MPEISNYTLNHRELAEVLIKHLDIHEGKWFASFNFNFLGANLGTEAGNALPTGLVQIARVGLQRAEGNSGPPELTVDAAEVNPAKGKAATKKGS